MKKLLIISLTVNVLAIGIFGKRYVSPKSAALTVHPRNCITVGTTLRIDSFKVGKIKKILILGNSIVRHEPLPAIGWTNDCGMAASSADSDFVHLLIRDIKSKRHDCEVKFENISTFEREFDTYNFAKADGLKDFNPDLIVMRICENVDSNKAIEKGFIKYYDSLLNYIDIKERAAKIIVGGFWRNDPVNRMLSDYAYLKGYTFLEQASIYCGETKAVGLWENPGIQEHPNDKGMRRIKETIWEAVKNYFP